jgi:ankyrin repeat protein
MAIALKRLAKLCRSASLAQRHEFEELLQQLPAARLELNGNGDTPLHLSCRHGNLLATQLTLQIHPQSVDKRNKVGHTALHEACLSTSTAIVALLLTLDIDVNRTKHGRLAKSRCFDMSPGVHACRALS